MSTNEFGFLLLESNKSDGMHHDNMNNVEHLEFAGKSYAIYYSNNIFRVKLGNNLIVIDGYTFPDDFHAIANAMIEEDYHYLAKAEGHFCGVVINPGGIVGFNDRYGGKTLYWKQHSEHLIITSRIANMPIYDLDFNKLALSESCYYRWTTGRDSLLPSVKKLIIRSVVKFSNPDTIVQHSYWRLTQPEHNNVPLAEKVSQTKFLLIKALNAASQKYKKVAIFLSGGVDSSILAALSKDIFQQCYLITPVFSGEENPELETAKVFAKSLNIPHYLIEIDPTVLEADLKKLISLKREPLRHYSSLAMMAMMKAVPEEFDAVIYGEAADTLYGSNGIHRFITHARWKKQSQYIPLLALKLIKKIIPGRGKVLVDLKSKSLRDILLSITEIKYSPAEKQVIAQLCGEEQAEISDWDWHKTVNDISPELRRHAAQERILSSDAAVHFNEAEIIAQHFGKHIISPFFSDESICLSSSLTDDDYFGDSYVKPVLRELACEYFSRELIYQKKHGFPVPFIAWLNGPLKHLVSSLRAERTLFDGRILDDFTVNDNFEIFWLLINWQILSQHLDKCCVSDDTT
jgi:asparagine synthase (glutamine-hydrolysing)